MGLLLEEVSEDKECLMANFIGVAAPTENATLNHKCCL